jgi:hypothetical protein
MRSLFRLPRGFPLPVVLGGWQVGAGHALSSSRAMAGRPYTRTVTMRGRGR